MLAETGLLLLLGYAPMMAAPAGLAPGDPVSAAIVRAVRSRVGHGATVTISGVSGVRLAAEAKTLIALPDPLARIGVPMRFVLSDGRPGGSRARIGEATRRWLL